MGRNSFGEGLAKCGLGAVPPGAAWHGPGTSEAVFLPSEPTGQASQGQMLQEETSLALWC